MDPIITLNNLSFRYEQDWILDDLSISIPRGAFVAVIGPNGCGKSTLLKTICRMLLPQKGTVQIKGKELGKYGHRELAREVAMVHQHTSANFGLTCEEVVMMGRYPYQTTWKWENSEDSRITKECMMYCGVWEFRKRSMSELSGGEFQRLMIAKALAQQTDIVLMDEPVASLDLKYQIEILRLCRQLISEKGITIIAPIHDINLAMQFSDLTIIMDKGKIVAYGETRETISHINIENLYDIKVKQIYDAEENIYYFPAI